VVSVGRLRIAAILVKTEKAFKYEYFFVAGLTEEI
jgi:hypothetical protein